MVTKNYRPLTYAVWLASVLHHLVVDKADDVWPDGGFEHSRKMNILARQNFTLLAVNVNDGTRGHSSQFKY